MASTSKSQSSSALAPSYAGPWSKLRPSLTPWIASMIDAMGFTHMTPVQASTIPLFLSHKDVIVEAVTGSGKTLSYVIPILEMLLRRSDPVPRGQVGALVVVPTRELAIQVHKVFKFFLDAQPESASAVRGAQLVVGGSKLTPANDYAFFKDNAPHILVGTPGRLEELLANSGVRTTEMEALVLDEADRLLDLGFAASLRSILDKLPKQRRTGLFSATMTDAISELARIGLRNPVRVVVKVEAKTSERRTPASLENMYHISRPENRLAQLLRILRAETSNGARKAVVFFATCAQVNYLYKVLAPLGPAQLGKVRLHSLHGKQTPARREATFREFVADSGPAALLCTDVAARGLDLPDIDVVVQFDAPTDPKVFSHRCGRTARAGRSGRAVVLLSRGPEEGYVDFLRVKKIPLRSYAYLSPELEKTTEPEGIDDDAQALTDTLRTSVRSDRALYDLSVLALVSFVRAYSKHEASFIFRDLEVHEHARCYGLLRLPRMPEATSGRTPRLALNQEIVDLDTLAFADPQREKQRQVTLEKKRSDPTPPPPPKVKKDKKEYEAWSKQKERKEKREIRRTKKERKRAFLARQKEEEEEQQELDKQEEDDWAQEEREAKRAKRSAPQPALQLDLEGF